MYTPQNTGLRAQLLSLVVSDLPIGLATGPRQAVVSRRAILAVYHPPSLNGAQHCGRLLPVRRCRTRSTREGYPSIFSSVVATRQKSVRSKRGDANWIGPGLEIQRKRTPSSPVWRGQVSKPFKQGGVKFQAVDVEAQERGASLVPRVAGFLPRHRRTQRKTGERRRPRRGEKRTYPIGSRE